MANDFLTLADVAVFDNIDDDLRVSDVLDDAPTVAAMSAITTEGRTYTYEKKTQNPVTGFRAANAGRDFDKGEHTEVIVGLKILDASHAVDWAVAAADKRGTDVRLAMELEEHLRSGFYSLEDQIWNGTDGANGFPSIPSQMDASMKLPDGTPGGGNDGAPLYALRLGPKDCNIVMGEQGQMAIGDTIVMNLVDGSGKNYPVYYTPVGGWFGTMVGSIYSAGGIDVGVQMTDDTLSDIYSLFPSGRKPNLFVTNREGLRQIQQSRTATNPTGQPAPFPNSWSGGGSPIPIITTDALPVTASP